MKASNISNGCLVPLSEFVPCCQCVVHLSTICDRPGAHPSESLTPSHSTSFILRTQVPTANWDLRIRTSRAVLVDVRDWVGACGCVGGPLSLLALWTHWTHAKATIRGSSGGGLGCGWDVAYVWGAGRWQRGRPGWPGDSGTVRVPRLESRTIIAIRTSLR
jgi:hypothetical protein